MATMYVTENCYKILASILDDLGDQRIGFTYTEFTQAVKSMGFGARSYGILIPPRCVGKKIFRINQDKYKMNKVVSPTVQERWKRELFKLYGWTAETFRCRQLVEVQ